jgi:hypothetical protein
MEENFSNDKPQYCSAEKCCSSSTTTIKKRKNQIIKKSAENCTEEYRIRRERNNIAAKKSREKANMRIRETQEKILFLENDNKRLQKNVYDLIEELNNLQALFTNTGEIQLIKHLENIQ